MTWLTILFGVFMKFEYKLSQVHPRIFVLELDSDYDLGMTFLRAQEFYESVNDQFRGKTFSLLSYMNWYASCCSKDKDFTYTTDFRGYNVPSTTIEQCYAINTERTPYDKFFLGIHEAIISLGVPRFEYYLLGAPHADAEVLEHEFAHALFFIDDKYREAMTRLVSLLPFQAELFTFLETKLEYAKNVHVDEAQAYMATGFTDDFEDKVKEYEPFTEPFKQVFNEWHAEILPPVTLVHRTVDLFDTKHI